MTISLIAVSSWKQPCVFSLTSLVLIVMRTRMAIDSNRNLSKNGREMRRPAGLSFRI